MAFLPSTERLSTTLAYDLELDWPDAVFWTPADWAWVGGWLDTVLPAWQHGQTVVSTQRRFNEEWAFDFMARHGVTHSFMTPTALKRLAQVPAPRERWKLATRVICTGGESLPGDVVRWADEEFGIVVNEFYGLTEFNHMVGCCKALYPVVSGSMGIRYPAVPAASLAAHPAQAHGEKLMYQHHFALTRLPFETQAHTDELSESTPGARPKHACITSSNSRASDCSQSELTK